MLEVLSEIIRWLGTAAIFTVSAAGAMLVVALIGTAVLLMMPPDMSDEDAETAAALGRAKPQDLRLDGSAK